MKAFKGLRLKKFTIVIFIWKSITTISFTNYEILQPPFSFIATGAFSIGGLSTRHRRTIKKLLRYPIILPHKTLVAKIRYYL